ncbi:hypothetical protein EI94DRAFT_1707940 [Lactarius quietus]|nr:hypothetical protein EI94DRAFT_1707940 [Lactarius quietus]
MPQLWLSPHLTLVHTLHTLPPLIHTLHTLVHQLLASLLPVFNIPTSAASSAHSTWVSPRRAALKSTIQAWPVLGPSQPAAASKAVAPKAKHRCEPSPPQNEKRAKGSNEVPSSSPCPAFLSLVQEGVASSSQANAVPTVDCAKPLPPKTPRAKALRKGASTHRAMAKTHVAPSDTDTDAVPLASKDLVVTMLSESKSSHGTSSWNGSGSTTSSRRSERGDSAVVLLKYKD